MKYKPSCQKRRVFYSDWESYISAHDDICRLCLLVAFCFGYWLMSGWEPATLYYDIVERYKSVTEAWIVSAPLVISRTIKSRRYRKVKDTKHDHWPNQNLLHHLQHAKNQLNSSIYSWDKAVFKVSGPKRSHPYLTMCIPKVWSISKLLTDWFPDTIMYEHTKNLFIVVPQLVNKFPSQHWTKRPKIV